MKRIRFLYVILAVLVLASVGPLLFYGLKMLEINRRELETKENLLQSTITRSVAEEIEIYNDAFRQQLDNLDHILEANSSLLGGPGQSRSSQWRATLERVVSTSPNIIYTTLPDSLPQKIKELKESYKDATLSDKSDYFNTELPAVLELGCMLETAEAILISALAREESRGAHSRTDFPKRDDIKWLRHTLIRKVEGELKISYKDVTITRFQPAERKY